MLRAIAMMQSGFTLCKRVAAKIKRAARKIKCWLQTIDWDRLLRTIRARVTSQLHAIWGWIQEHPYLIALLVVCVIVAVAAPHAYGPVLGAAGFSAAGPVAGSFAAAMQAAIGPVAAGSILAVLQSAAMGGYGVAVFTVAIPTVAAVVASSVVGVAASSAWL